MFLQTYTGNARTNAIELQATVSAAVSPSQIASACAAVEFFLHNHAPDNQRWFFSITFPTLLCKIFGFHESSPSSDAGKLKFSNGWIDVASSGSDPGLAGKIFSLLSPNGLLLSSIVEIDRLSMVKYVFPSERLPEWCRYMLQSANYRRAFMEMCPLFKSRITEEQAEGSSYQVQLNVFDYYFFWFVYYPVYRGNRESSEGSGVSKVKRFSLENWSHSIHALSSTKHDANKKREDNLYMRLVYVYLHAYAPLQLSNVPEPYGSSLLHCSSTGDSPVKERAAFVVNVMVYFWLVGNDSLPFSMGLCKSLGVVFPVKPIQRDTPPSPGMGDVINVFIKYLNWSQLEAYEMSNQIEFSGSMQSRYPGSTLTNRGSLGFPSGSWSLNFQRPLYRYILRTFLFCPVEGSIKNAYQAFSVWVNYMEPWKISFDEFTDLNETFCLSKKVSSGIISKSPTPGYSSCWQQYILDNYLFYSSLAMHFIGFAHRVLHSDLEMLLKMVTKVLNILTSSVELRDLIKNTEAVFHSKVQESSLLPVSSPSKYIPSIREQLEDWENGLFEDDVDRPFLHENWKRDLLLFASGEDSGQQLLQLLLVRAETELHAVSGSSHSQDIDLLKCQLRLLYVASPESPSCEMPNGSHQEQYTSEVFTPKSFGSKAGVEIKYKGDWMNRPISNDEIAWLASLLVSISFWLNEKLGLNQAAPNQRHKGWSYVQVHNDESSVRGTAETVRVMFISVAYWIACLIDAGLEIMRTHGIRVNLRVLASKRIAMMLLLVAGFSLLKKALRK